MQSVIIYDIIKCILRVCVDALFILIELNVRCEDVKKGIHPEYKDAVIKCACGAEVKTKSTSGDMHVDICSKCHPFFTGKQKFVDAGGRLDKFKKRLEAAGK